MSKFSIPNLDNLYNEVVAWVKEHQGEKGYINTDYIVENEDGTEDILDTLYSFYYNDAADSYEERIVYGVRVREDDLEVCSKPYMRTYHNNCSEDEYLDDISWYSVRWSDIVLYVPTLFSIAENIEEYTEE